MRAAGRAGGQWFDLVQRVVGRGKVTLQALGAGDLGQHFRAQGGRGVGQQRAQAGFGGRRIIEIQQRIQISRGMDRHNSE